MKQLATILILGVLGLALWHLAKAPREQRLPTDSPPAGPGIVPPPPDAKANVSTGTRGLNVIALAQEGYSVGRGGGGVENFSAEFAALTNKMDWQWTTALVQGANRAGHLEGYQFELIEHPDGGFRSNFLAVARPAAGFFGPELRVDKRRVVWTNETTGKPSTVRTERP